MAVPGDRITYVGHATVLLELGGVRVLTDPVLRDRVLLLRRRGRSADYEALAGPDLVLLSHPHYDHLDLHSLRQVATGSELLAPGGSTALARRAGVARVTEVEAGRELEAAGLRVEVTDAEHEGPRRPLGRTMPAVGYVVSTPSRSIYFAGDTDLFEGMRELRGRIDVALLPVAGWGPRVGAGHLDAARAARAVELIAPEIVVPIHWGTFAAPLYRIRDLGEPPRELARLVSRRSPGSQVAVLEPGESLKLHALT